MSPTKGEKLFNRLRKKKNATNIPETTLNISKAVSRDMSYGLGIYNHTTNMTFDNPLELMAQVPGLQNLPSTQLTAGQHWYQPYPTTLGLIIFLHVVYFCQWNTRKTRKQTLVSYRQLIQEKKYYKAVMAMLSHPPADSSSSSPTVAIEFGSAAEPQSRFHSVLKGHLSGLPLLAYNCHLLWTCRALVSAEIALCFGTWE